MSVEEFLAWDDGTDIRYELENGIAAAMSPASPTHGRLAQNVGNEIDRHVASRPPCRALQAAGVVVSRKSRKVYVPDVVMTCEELAGTTELREPRLIVEVLSPTTKGIDQKSKVPAYGSLPSVAEIWLVASDERWVLVWKRTSAAWVADLPYVGRQSFQSAVLDGEVALDRLYGLTGIEAQEPT